MRSRFLVPALAASGGFLFALVTSQHEAAAKPPVAASEAVPVAAAPVVRGDVPIGLDGLGRVQAFNTVTLRSQAEGQIERIAGQERPGRRAEHPAMSADAAPDEKSPLDRRKTDN